MVMAQSGDGIESLLIRDNEDDIRSIIHAALKNNYGYHGNICLPITHNSEVPFQA